MPIARSCARERRFCKTRLNGSGRANATIFSCHLDSNWSERSICAGTPATFPLMTSRNSFSFLSNAKRRGRKSNVGNEKQSSNGRRHASQQFKPRRKRRHGRNSDFL